MAMAMTISKATPDADALADHLDFAGIRGWQLNLMLDEISSHFPFLNSTTYLKNYPMK